MASYRSACRHGPAPLALCALMLLAGARASLARPAEQGATSDGAADTLRVRISCDRCDLDHLRQSLDLVEVVAADAAADVDVQIRTQPLSADERGLIAITGLGRFDGLERRIGFALPPGAIDAAFRAQLAARVRLGLVEFVAGLEDAPELDIEFMSAADAAADDPGERQEDPWRHWVFRVGADAYVSGESQTSSAYYSVSGSANRTTERWKIRIASNRSLNTSRFTFDDETVESRLTEWDVNALAVISLGGQWSAGVTGAVIGSTFSNSRRVVRVAPAIEFDVFPYAESSQRSLTAQYALGGAHYEYEAATIFGKLEESIMQHGLDLSLGLRQPWGQTGSSLSFTQHLSAPERTRITFNGNFNVRLARSISLTTSGTYARIRDQFTLERGDATPEEVLLRQRQLATGYRYSFRVGVTYSFGALGNATVNPRFGG